MSFEDKHHLHEEVYCEVCELCQEEKAEFMNNEYYYLREEKK